MSKIFQEGHRKLQDQFDSRRLADRIEELLLQTELGEGEKAFIEASPMFFLSTVDPRGYPTCSYKGGAPGFVKVLDPKTILFPSYNGNGMFLSTGNILSSPKVGLLFINFEEPDRIRVHGEASIDLKDPAISHFPGAEFVVKVHVHEVFPNCPRYIHQYELVNPSEYVPDTQGQAPTPEWKEMDWAVDVLPGKKP